MTTPKDHPVWEVYDLQRTCRLNKKYWSEKLAKVKQLNFAMEYLLMAAAPGSAISGLVYWKTDKGVVVWSILMGVTAIISVAKPLLKLSEKIENLNKVITGYRVAEFEFEQLSNDIRREAEYSTESIKTFKRLQKGIGEIIKEEPIERINEDLSTRCFETVKKELPENSFYIPET